MDQRKETRLKADQTVVVTDLGLAPLPPVSGRVLDMSGSGLRLRLPNPLPCGSRVRVETPRMVMLGEVSRCDDDAGGKNGGFVVGLTLSRITVVEDPAAAP